MIVLLVGALDLALPANPAPVPLLTLTQTGVRSNESTSLNAVATLRLRMFTVTMAGTLASANDKQELHVAPAFIWREPTTTLSLTVNPAQQTSATFSFEQVFKWLKVVFRWSAVSNALGAALTLGNGGIMVNAGYALNGGQSSFNLAFVLRG